MELYYKSWSKYFFWEAFRAVEENCLEVLDMSESAGSIAPHLFNVVRIILGLIDFWNLL